MRLSLASPWYEVFPAFTFHRQAAADAPFAALPFIGAAAANCVARRPQGRLRGSRRPDGTPAYRDLFARPRLRYGKEPRRQCFLLHKAA